MTIAVPFQTNQTGRGAGFPSGVTVVSHATSSPVSRRSTCLVSSNVMSQLNPGTSGGSAPGVGHGHVAAVTYANDPNRTDRYRRDREASGLAEGRGYRGYPRAAR